jgi:hypothetical protein
MLPSFGDLMRAFALSLVLAGCTGVVPVGEKDDTDVIDDTDTTPPDDTDETQPDDTDDTDPVVDDTDPPVGGTVGDLGPGDLVFSELMIDPGACIDDDAEYVEVHNTTGSAVNLTGLVLRDAGTTWTSAGGSVAAGGRAVLFRTPLGTQCYGFAGALNWSAALALSNLGETLTLEDGTGEVLDTVTWTSADVRTGASFSYDDASSTWCPSTSTIPGSSDRGTPGATNDPCTPDTDPPDTDTDSDTPIDTDPPVGPGTGLLITEIADPVNFDARFVEIANLEAAPVSTVGWTLQRYSNGGSSPTSFTLPTVVLNPGQYYVIANNAAELLSEFGVTADTTWSGVNGNGNDVYALANNGVVVDVYGVIGVDGLGEDWEYTDIGSSRRPEITAPRAAFEIDEWIIDAPFTPGGAAAPPVIDTGLDTFDSGWDSTWWDSGDTGDTDTEVPVDTDTGSGGGVVTGPSVIISEIADPVDFNGRFVELANTGTATRRLGGMSLHRYSNGSTTPATVALPDVSLAPGEVFVVAGNSAGFTSLFGLTADFTWSGVNGNGNDVYALFEGGAAVDVYGVIGVDGVGEDWEYTDVGATRRPWVLAPRATLRMAEWELTTAHSPGGHTYSAVIDTGPGDTALLDTFDTDPVDTDPVDTDPVDTDPVDTDVIDTDPVDTDPVDTDPVDTDPVDTDPVDTDVVDTDPVGTAVLLLSEVADPTDFTARFVEVVNVGDAPRSLLGVSLQRYSNGGTTPSSFPLPDVQLVPGETFVIAGNASAFQSFFSVAADTEWSGVNGNGNDVYALEETGSVFDVYGVIGVDGLGEPWEYTDSGATRRGWVTAPTATFALGEWQVGLAHSPGVHVTLAGPVETGDTGDTYSFDTADTDIVDTDVVDTDVVDTFDTDVPVDSDVDTALTIGPLLLLSEVADPVSSNQRFIEIWNAGDEPAPLAGWRLEGYFNGSLSSSNITLTSTAIVPPGGTWVVANNGPAYLAAYGRDADQTSGTVNSNGDDVWVLAVDDGSGFQAWDVFGVLGTDGTGEAWEYTDQIAQRNPFASLPTTTFDLSWWTITASGTETPGVAP